MSRSPTIALALLATLGCSEYDLVGDKESPPEAHDSAAPEEEPLPDTAPPVDSGTVEDTAPPDETCEEWVAPADYTVTRDSACLREPTVGTFNPVVEWQWNTNAAFPGYDDIMSTPAVGNLNDDNGDGLVNEDDVPDIVFTSFSGGAYGSAGTLTAVSGDGSGTLWSVYSVSGVSIASSSGVAIGDIDADGQPDICVSGTQLAVVCVEGDDGHLKWAQGGPPFKYGAPAMADMDGDGLSEVIFGNIIFDHTGAVVGTGAGGTGRYHSYAVDWDGDGQLEVVAGSHVYERNGSIAWTDGRADGFSAVGDFDGDGRPDLVRTGGGQVSVVDNAGTLLWQTTLPGGGSGGAPTVADFDGDGMVEVGVADRARYTVFDGNGAPLWSNTVSDYSSSQTGSSVFDFEGDGDAEVVYADEHSLWIFEGATGNVLMQQGGHASGTIYEYPLIADVDNDGSTEIIVASNNYAFSGWNGITVIGDAGGSWAPARPIWNQYAYHITNVENDGSIPVVQIENWGTWNNFRTGGTELGPAHWQPDLSLAEPEFCLDDCELDRVQIFIPVENTGLIAAEDYTLAAWRTGESEAPVLTEQIVSTTDGEAGWHGVFTVDRATWGAGSLVIGVDTAGTIDECDETNNELDAGAWPCP
jgi:hypothetical protein